MHKRKSYHVCQTVCVVEAAIAGRSYDIVQLICRQAEVRDLLKAPVHVLYVHSVILHPKQMLEQFEMHFYSPSLDLRYHVEIQLIKAHLHEFIMKHSAWTAACSI